MPRRARIHLVSLKSSLVNLPISIYGPLLERGVRPQGLAVHLSLVPPPGRQKKEAYVGWTGMASASSLANFNAPDGGDSAGTIEIDPQYAIGLGFTQGDMVEIGLLHDLAYAKAIGTEPVSSDDWEIIEIHASHVESTLLSQVRVANIGQEVDVWVLGRTRVRLTVVSLDPQNKGPLLLTTNSEVSIAPKVHRRRQALPGKAPLPLSTPAANGGEKATSTPTPALSKAVHILRVLPGHVLPQPAPSHQDTEILGFVSPSTFAKLAPLKEGVAFVKSQIKRLPSPPDPTIAKSDAEAEPVAKVLKPGETQAPLPSLDTVYVGILDGIPSGHIVFPTAVKDVEDWDVVNVTPTSEEAFIALSTTVNGIKPLGAHTNILAGVDEILTRCKEFCLKSFIMHSTRVSVRGVSSLLITGRSGAGKTSIVKAVAKSFQENPQVHAFVYYVDVAPYAEKPVSTIKSLFKYWFDKAAWHKPSILVLDNIETVLKAEEEHIDSFRTRQLVELFVYLYSSSPRSASPNSRGVVLIAIASSASALHPLLNSKHIFSDTVHVNAPNKDARRDILAHIVKERLAVAEDMKEDSESPLNYSYIATQTEGYSATDLQDLVARATHQAAVKSVTGDHPPLLTQEDFDSAQMDFVPLSLRDVKMQKSDVTWSDIGGLKETRRVLRETLEWPTKYGPIFAQSPLRLRSGLLLYGYPGCGKTLLASAVAKECGLNFISVKGPEVLNKYIGESEKTVRDLFERASAAKPCVLFFDEFDSIAPKRGHDSTGVTDRVVNQMLTQMDGAEGLEGVYVLAATSRPDLIDSALLRPGRLDKSLLCDIPDLEEREDILRAVTRKVTMDSSVNLKDIAQATEGFSGADLQALIYNANLEAVHASINVEISGSSGGDEEDAIEFTTFGGPNAQLVRSKAEKMALQKRLRLIQDTTHRKTDSKTGTPDVGKPAKKKHIIYPEHLRSVLTTTRPSVSTDERKRLDRIYREFTSDRTGELPVPPEGEGVGTRASLG